MKGLVTKMLFPYDFEDLKQQALAPASGEIASNVYRARGYAAHTGEENVIARAYAIRELFVSHRKHLYANDRFAGSVRGLRDDFSKEELARADKICEAYPERWFWLNSDHYAANYAHFLPAGVEGTLAEIDASLKNWEGDAEKTAFLRAARITMEAFSEMILGYAEAADAMADAAANEDDRARFADIAARCRRISFAAPQNFRDALQLLWMTYVAFAYEGRFAMAFGRMDQYLYPYFARDIEAGILTEDDVVEDLASVLVKIGERCVMTGGDDVCNIAIGGVKPEDGSDATNRLSFCLIRAVRKCFIPGPNLSARLHRNTTDEFMDACLESIGTGLGYPALMNDEVNIPALLRMGYALEDCRNYCMVGCIENFMQGKQPPWSDSRFNTPLYLEYALNNGRSFLDGEKHGIETGDPDSFTSMDELIAAFTAQIRYGAENHIKAFDSYNNVADKENMQSPFLSCFCDDCIARGLDINRGGAVYKSAHAACSVGIASVADSLAAIETVVFRDHVVTLGQLRDALAADFVGYEELRQKLLDAPKYGNDNDVADKYAIWFVKIQAEIFDEYRTYDGGRFYVAIASNVQNVSAGREVGATPDGRRAMHALSDAASPMHGMDRSGPTASALSLCKPDYTLVACGTVVNQKYTPEMFANPEKRAKLGAVIRSYFLMGGQELQINCVSKDTLRDAQMHPENYESLVVRVSGFSAYYTKLEQAVQDDILSRTEHF
ncbi:MAG: hypothetical protein J6S76_02695 [Clostridia bacterium]|nr:hypothetical protein [Clostridia bacterium]